MSPLNFLLNNDMQIISYNERDINSCAKTGYIINFNVINAVIFSVYI